MWTLEFTFPSPSRSYEGCFSSVFLLTLGNRRSNHIFTCAVSETEKAHGSIFPCRLEYTKTRVVPATLTDFFSNTINVGQVTQKPGLHLYALGVLFVTPVGDLLPIHPVLIYRILTHHIIPTRPQHLTTKPLPLQLILLRPLQPQATLHCRAPLIPRRLLSARAHRLE